MVPANFSYVGGADAHQASSTNPFIFEGDELPFFCQFLDTLSKILQDSDPHPKLGLAIAYYAKACAEDGALDEIMDLFICLESILTQKSYDYHISSLSVPRISLGPVRFSRNLQSITI